tara:strand:- start:464 stop:832 length:369 start_codon:yes stop_codon:yes gene_type:complete
MFLEGVVNRIISMLFLAIYCISLSPFLFHNHNHDHEHQVLFCEEIAINDFDSQNYCTHESHVLKGEEACNICDHLTIQDKIVSNNTLSQSILFGSSEAMQRIEAVYLYERNTFLNKSPPFKA